MCAFFTYTSIFKFPTCSLHMNHKMEREQANKKQTFVKMLYATFAQACCQNNQHRICLSLQIQDRLFALCMHQLHPIPRLDEGAEQSWQRYLGTCCLNLLFGTRAARPLLTLIGIHTSFEWVCIWTRSSFSPFLLFPEEYEQPCEAGELFNSRTVR